MLVCIILVVLVRLLFSVLSYLVSFCLFLMVLNFILSMVFIGRSCWFVCLIWEIWVYWWFLIGIGIVVFVKKCLICRVFICKLFCNVLWKKLLFLVLLVNCILNVCWLVLFWSCIGSFLVIYVMMMMVISLVYVNLSCWGSCGMWVWLRIFFCIVWLWFVVCWLGCYWYVFVILWVKCCVGMLWRFVLRNLWFCLFFLICW